MGGLYLAKTAAKDLPVSRFGYRPSAKTGTNGIKTVESGRSVDNWDHHQHAYNPTH
jgi:hypothetical protein